MHGGFARNTFYGAVAGLLNSFGRFVTTIVLARTLGVHGTGIVNYLLWISAMLTALTDLGAYATLSRYLPELMLHSEGGLTRKLTNFMFAPFAALTALIYGTFLVIAIWLLRHPHVTSVFGLEGTSAIWLLGGMVYAAQAFSNFAMGYFQGMQEFAKVARLGAAGMALQAIVVAIGGRFWGVDGALIGYAIGFGVPAVAGLALVGLDRGIPLSLRTRILRYAGYSWASALAAAFVWARLEVAFLGHYLGVAAVGLYSVAFTLASLAIQGPVLLTSGLLPYFAENSGRADHARSAEMLTSSTRLMAFAVLPISFGAAALVPELLPILYGHGFSPATPAAVMLVAFAGIGANMVVPMNLINGHERSDFIFFCNASAALVSVGLSWALVPRFGLLGAACGRSLVQVYFVIITSWFVTKRLGFSLPIGEMMKIAGASLACALVAHFVAARVSGVTGVVLAVPAGACVYFVLVRLLVPLPHKDATRLAKLAGRLPATLGRYVTATLLMIASPSSE